MEEYLKHIKNSIICRNNIIVRLYSLIGIANEPMPESIFIHGHMATGKSLIIQSLLSYLQHNVSYINCIEHLGSKHMYNYILHDLTVSTEDSSSNIQSKHNCDNMVDFIYALKTISCNDKRPIVLVFDKVHKIRDFDITFMPAMLRLRELSDVNLCTIFISEIPWTRFRSKIGTLEPVKVYFPQYTKEELIQLLLLDKPKYDVQFYKNYLNLFLSVYFRFCRDLNELRHMAKINFTKYIEPLKNEQIEPDNTAALWRNISTTFKSNLEVIYLRVSTDDLLQSGHQISREIESTTKLALSFELPFYTKYILIAAYLASHSLPKYDQRIFMKRSDKKKKKTRFTKNKMETNSQMKPRVFTITRMLAIFCAILDEKVDINANLMAQISTMCQLGLLIVSGESIFHLDEPKYKCCASRDFVTVVAKTVGFDLKSYLNIDMN